MIVITSTQNEKIKQIKALLKKTERDARSLFFVEGRKLCEEAIRDARVDVLLVDDARKEAYEGLFPAAREVVLASTHVIASICETKTPQGIAALVAMPAPLSLTEANGPLLVLDGLQDPGNVGTMLRTAEAAGFSGALLSPTSADAFTPKTVRASMGSVLRLPVFRGPLENALLSLHQQGYTLYATALDGQDALSCKPKAPFALIIGSEGQGISETVLEMADTALTLPMRGRAESLNAAVAAGILMYHLMDGAPCS